MRNIKKIIGLVALSAAMVFGVAASSHNTQVNASQVSTADQARTAYKAFMGKNKKISVDYINGYDFKNAQCGKFETKTKKISAKSFIHYVFQDLNSDGVPELIVSDRHNYCSVKGKVLVCTYKDGKVKPVICVRGLRSGIYMATGNKICLGFGASTEETYVFTKLSGTNIKHVATYRKQTIRQKGNKINHKYYKNAGKSTKAKFNTAKNKIIKEIKL